MENVEPFFSFNLWKFQVDITLSIVVQWAIILILTLLAFYLTRSLRERPTRKQNIGEIFVETIIKLVKDNMGENYIGFVPFVGTIFIYLLLMNLTGLIGIEPPTKDINIALAMAIIAFIVIQGYTIKKLGLIHYFIGYTKPFAAMLPMNIMERFMLPLSLCLRLFGNMTAAAVIMDLVYRGLHGVGFLAQIGVPVFLHFYFDIFDGVIQMIIFLMLTMINIKIISEH